MANTRSNRKRVLDVLDPESLLEENQNLKSLQTGFIAKEKEYNDKIQSLEFGLLQAKNEAGELKTKINTLEFQMLASKKKEESLLEKINSFEKQLSKSQITEGDLLKRIATQDNARATLLNAHKINIKQIGEQKDEIAQLQAICTAKQSEVDELKQQISLNSASAGVDVHEQDETELLPAVRIKTEVFNGLHKETKSRLVRSLVDVMFTKEKQTLFSTTGKRGKTSATAKPPLPEDRVAAIRAHARKVFPDITITETNKLINNKLRDTCKE